MAPVGPGEFRGQGFLRIISQTLAGLMPSTKKLNRLEARYLCESGGESPQTEVRSNCQGSEYKVPKRDNDKACLSNQRPVVKIMRIVSDDRPRPELPRYMSSLAAGIDLQACLKSNIDLKPGESGIIPTGLRMAIPEGYEGQVRPRSGLAAKFGVTVLNSPGTIDADYRGEVGVILINLGSEPYTIANGDRIAQLVIAPVIQAELVEADSLDDTERGEGGFGSTGISGAHGKRCTDGRRHCSQT